MRVEGLTIEGCPFAGGRRRERPHRVGHGGTDVVKMRTLLTVEDTASGDFGGSPTVLIDGVDAVPGTAPIDHLACRVYPTGAGLAGAPSVAQLSTALTR